MDLFGSRVPQTPPPPLLDSYTQEERSEREINHIKEQEIARNWREQVTLRTPTYYRTILKGAINEQKYHQKKLLEEKKRFKQQQDELKIQIKYTINKIREIRKLGKNELGNTELTENIILETKGELRSLWNRRQRLQKQQNQFVEKMTNIIEKKEQNIQEYIQKLNTKKLEELQSKKRSTCISAALQTFIEKVSV